MMLTQHTGRVVAAQALVTLVATREGVSLPFSERYPVFHALWSIRQHALTDSLLTFELSVGPL